MAGRKVPAKTSRPSSRGATSLLDVSVRNATAIVVLNRPELHNAFNEALIAGKSLIVIVSQ